MLRPVDWKIAHFILWEVGICMNCEYESIIDFEVVYYLIMKMYCKLSFILTMFAKKTMTYNGIQILGYWCKHNYI